MPAMLEDPTAPAIYRISGNPPYPTPDDSQVPYTIVPRKVTLRDRITIASLLPFSTATAVPPRLLSYLCSQLNLEIEKGDTYPMMTSMAISTFGNYWFQNFGAIMLLGEVESVEQVWEMENGGVEWDKVCLGSFYVKPNYPGRSSHVCNGGFLVTEAARNKGVGRLMGEGYLEWAPKLVYLLLCPLDFLFTLSATEPGLTFLFLNNVIQMKWLLPSMRQRAFLIWLARDTRTQSSTSSTKLTLHHAGFGMPSASNASAGSLLAETCAPPLTN